MGNRGVAPVVDLEQARHRRARRGAQIGRGQARRTYPGYRGPRVEWAVDWEAMAKLDRHEIVAIEKGSRRPPMQPRGMRRSQPVGVGQWANPPARNVKGVLSRQARRLGWKVERKLTKKFSGEKVAWGQSKGAMGALAPVIPIKRRGVLARIRASLPHGGRPRVGDLKGDAA